MDTTAQTRRGALFAVTATQFAVPFMVSAVGVALPVIGEELSASAVQLGLVESGYLAAVAMMMFPCARLSDMYGRGLLFVSGVAMFTVMSLLLGMSQNIEMLIVFRVMQGLGGAAQVATGLAILTEVFPREERGRALGIAVTGVYIGLSLGPYFGGLIATHWGWRWIFFVGIPACLVALYMSFRGLDVRLLRDRTRRFDWGGFILSASGLGMMVLGSAEWEDMAGKALFAASLVLLSGFVWWERRHDSPLLDMGLFLSSRSFAYGSAVQFINYAATFGVTFLMSLYLQTVQGMTAGQAGTILVAQPLVQAALSTTAGRMADRWPPHRIATAGMAVATVGLAVAAGFDEHTAVTTVVGILMLFGTGIALFSAPNTSVIMGSVPPEHYATASAMTGGMRTTGMTVSLVCIGMFLSVFMGEHAVTVETHSMYLQAMQWALGCFAVVSGAGVVLSLRAPMPQRADEATESRGA